MRYLTFVLLILSLSACATRGGTATSNGTADQRVAEVMNLKGPAYDPSTSPIPLTPYMVLPAPSGNTGQPNAYGSVYDPGLYPPATAPLSPGQNAKGEAPETYGQYDGTYAQPSTYAPTTPEEWALAETLNGLWINATDDRELVEFTPDHYTTFYDGKLLFQEPMTYHPTCPSDCNGGAPLDLACFTVTGPAGMDCYAIVRLTPEVMELSMLGVSTETIVYYKQ